MAYNKQTWIDEKLYGAPLYNVTKDGEVLHEDVGIVLSSAVEQEGTPMVASRFNNMEQGIEDTYFAAYPSGRGNEAGPDGVNVMILSSNGGGFSTSFAIRRYLDFVYLVPLDSTRVGILNIYYSVLPNHVLNNMQLMQMTGSIADALAPAEASSVKLQVFDGAQEVSTGLIRPGSYADNISLSLTFLPDGRVYINLQSSDGNWPSYVLFENFAPLYFARKAAVFKA